MFESFLATTSTEGLKPLGTPAQRSFELITATVRHALGTRHAALFAEPVATQHGDRFDWYAPVAGKAVRLDGLETPRQSEARAVLAGLKGDIAALAARLRNASNAEDDRLAEALDNALEVPDEASVYVIAAGETAQPVLVNWAWVEDRKETVSRGLTGLDARPRAAAAARLAPPVVATVGNAAPAAIAQPVAGGAGWVWWLGFGWLLLLAMVCAILYLMIAPCGLSGWAVLNRCPAPVVARVAMLDRHAQIENTIAQLERRIGDAGRACRPLSPPALPDFPPPALPVDPPPARPVAPPAESGEIDERLDRAGAQRGDLSFSLAWDSLPDLDLHVFCPAGDRISFKQRRACNGELDVDANVKPSQARRDPVENIFFTDPAPGVYQVRVNLYSRGMNGPVPFRLQIRDGDGVEVLTGEVSSRRPTWQGTYEVGAE